MRGQCVKYLCEGDYNKEWPKCGWCKDVERCKDIQKQREAKEQK